MKKHKIIISGGGTGGHIFPAVAIAKAIENELDNIEFLFVGARDRMEMQKIPALGYNIEGLWISGLQRNISIRNLLFPVKLIYSLFHCFYLLYQFKPDIVIGTGGFASGPLLFMATLFNIPSLIQEQNSYPGITNRILGKYVQKICVAYDKMDRFFPKSKLELTGNPIRKDIIKFADRESEDNSIFLINKNNPTILIVGGSLGARTINEAILNNLTYFTDSKINLIWQTGSFFYKKAKKKVKEINGENITVLDFIKEIDLAYYIADIIVSRAGAIAISELSYVGKPIILVPSPNVAENHQYKNAQSLVNNKAALLVEDKDANCKLVSTIMGLVKNNDLKRELSNNIKKIAVSDASIRIASIALGLKNEY